MPRLIWSERMSVIVNTKDGFGRPGFLGRLRVGRHRLGVRFNAATENLVPRRVRIGKSAVSHNWFPPGTKRAAPLGRAALSFWPIFA